MMTIWYLAIREIRHRKGGFVLGLISVAIAVATLTGALSLLNSHDIRTRQILEDEEEQLSSRVDELNEQMRKTMLKLGFNMVILPEDQELGDWYANDYASRYMPESYVTKLADSGVVSVRHFLPSLQQKIRWPEQKRTIILVGTRGEVPNLHKNPVKPLVETVPPGTIVLGHELHQSLGLKVGDKVKLMRREFTVSRCHEERGSKDDITAWIHLGTAQELLNKKGKINAILALQCLCVGMDALPGIRKEISGILPGTQVVEQGSKVIARAESRLKVQSEGKALIDAKMQARAELRHTRGKLAGVLVPVIMIACGSWIALLGFANVRARRAEIGVLRAMGFRSKQVMALFLSKSVATGIVGGLLGLVGGSVLGTQLGIALEGDAVEGMSFAGSLGPGVLVLALVIASALSVIAGWIPATIAAGQDPAVVLRQE